MEFSPFVHTDLENLKEFEPPGWGDLVPRFERYLSAPVYNPVKLSQDGKMIAIGTSIFHKDTAWLATIIVHPEHRNNGFGKSITQYLLNNIDREIFQTIYLDATDSGFPVYRKLGFELETEYTHLKAGPEIVDFFVSDAISFYTEKYRQKIYELDHRVSGEDRSQLLSEHLLSTSIYTTEGNDLKGFYMPAFGEGLIVAENIIAGIELMKCRLISKQIAIFPAVNKQAMTFLSLHGFQQFRISRRMLLGRKRQWHPDKIYNRISGQLG
jgi:N-acetylglutamate synthase-like GNAT family acetyltransferase